MALLFTRQHLLLLLLNTFLAYLYLSRDEIKELASGIARQGSCGKQSVDALPPLEPREWTLKELREFDGIKDKRILIAIDWRVFDVSSGRHLYGPGRDATRSLAADKLLGYPDSFVQSFDDFLDLTVKEREVVNGWVDYFYQKYSEVGIVVRVRDERYVDPEDIFSNPGDHPRGGILTDLNINASI